MWPGSRGKNTKNEGEPPARAVHFGVKARGPGNVGEVSSCKGMEVQRGEREEEKDEEDEEEEHREGTGPIPDPRG